MKITFAPINPPAPVRPADMPEGVAYEYEHNKSLGIATNLAGVMHTVNREGKASAGISSLDSYFSRKCEVLKRRDGQPLPSAEGKPVPLDTLEPFPVWYERDSTYYAHDGLGGVAFYDPRRGYQKLSTCGSPKIKVLSTPHIMQVQP